MSMGLDRTIEILAASENFAACDLLVELVFHGDPERQVTALQIVVNKRHPESLFHLAAGYHLLSPDIQNRFIKLGARLSDAIRRTYLSADEQIYTNGCALIRALPDFDQAPLLLGSLLKESSRKRDAEKILLNLVNEMVVQLDTSPEERINYDIEGARQRMLATLRDGMRRYTLHHSDVVPESFLLLADEQAPEVSRILRESTDLCHRAMVTALRRRTHPRVFRWIYALLNTRHPPPVVLAIVGERDDPAFINYLLENIGQLVEPLVLNAVRRVTEIRWLRPDHRAWTTFTPEQQTAAVIFATHSGIPLTRKLELIAFILDEGTPVARQAAACALSQIPGADANQMIRACMDDDDPEVQLAATQQLRERGIANALGLLLRQLDHDDGRIRDAARRALSDYTLERYLGSFDSLDEGTKRALGSAILKIDTQARQTILGQLHSRQRRFVMRMSRILRTLGLTDDYLAEMLKLLADNDHLVRREIIESLSHSHQPDLVDRLVGMTADPLLQVGATEAIDFLRRNAIDPEIRIAAQSAGEGIGLARL